MLVKFGKLSPVTKYLMKEIVIVKVKTSHLSNSSQHVAEMDIFNEYYKAKVPFEPQWLQLLKACECESIIGCLFEGYLAKLFNFKVDFRPSRIMRTPDLNDVTPFIQANSKQTKKEIHKAKSDLQQRWKTAIFECYEKDEFTRMFREYVQRFVDRFEPLTK